MEVVPATCESDIPLMNVSVMDDTTDGEYSSPERVAPLEEGGGGGGGVRGSERGRSLFPFDVVVLTFSLVRTQAASVQRTLLYRV